MLFYQIIGTIGCITLFGFFMGLFHFKSLDAWFDVRFTKAAFLSFMKWVCFIAMIIYLIAIWS